MASNLRRTSSKNKNIADKGSCTISRRSIKHNIHKTCSKDHPVTALVLKDSDGRYIILTLFSVELDAHWKFLSPFVPVLGSDSRNHLGSGVHGNVDGLEPVLSPPVSLFQVDLQKEHIIVAPKSPGFANSCIAKGSCQKSILKQSYNRNKQTKSIKNFSSIDSCFKGSDSSSLVSNASTAAVSDVTVWDVQETDKPVKRSSRKKAKKKGKQHKKDLCKKDSIASEAVFEEISCDIPVLETSVNGGPSCLVDCITENNLSDTATSPSFSVQATIERDDSEGNSSDILDPSRTSVTWASSSDGLDESGPAASMFENFVVEDFSYNQSGSDESSSFLSNSSSAGETSEISTSNSSEDVTDVHLNQRNICDDIASDDSCGHHKPRRLDSLLDGLYSGNDATGGDGTVETQLCIKEDNIFSSPEGGEDNRFSSSEEGENSRVSYLEREMVLGCCSEDTGLHVVTANPCDIDTEIGNDCCIKSTYWQEDTVDTDSIIERVQCGSQACSSNTFHPNTLSKRGRHSKKVSDCSNGIDRHIHDQTGQDVNHSIWQKFQRNVTDKYISGPKNVNPISSQFDVASQGSEIKVKSDAVVVLRQKEGGKYCTHDSIDQMVTQTDPCRVASNDVGSNKVLLKSGDRNLHCDVPENLKRKPGPVLKQENIHNSRKGSHTGKTNMTMVSKIHVQTKEAPGISSPANYHKSHTTGLKSPCNSDTQRVGEIWDKTAQATETHINPLSRKCDSLNKTCMKEVLSDGNEFKICKDTHFNAGHLADSKGTGRTKLNADGLHAENSKQNQMSGPVQQKWIPVGKKDASVLNTSQTDTSTTSLLDGLVSDRWISESLDIEQLNALSRQFHQLTSSRATCSGPRTENVNRSIREDEGHKNKLKSPPLHMSKELNGINASSTCKLTQGIKDDSVCEFDTDLNKIIQVVNDAQICRVASEGIERLTGHPVAEFERLLLSASPGLGQLYCLQTCKSCSREQLIGNSMCQHQIPNISLGNLWQWYETPGTYGLEVKAEDYRNSKRMGNDRFEFRAYFVPYLSAVQLFGKPRNVKCTKNSNSDGKVKKACEVGKIPTHSSKLSTLPIFPLLPHQQMNKSYLDAPSPSPKDEHSNNIDSSRGLDLGGLDEEELLFEYFESDQPQQRRPLFEKIQQLVRGDAFLNCQIFGDPSQLECIDLHDLHPASWFSVAWYPIYRIPDGNLRSAFLTYHSLGHFIHRSSSNFPGGVTCVVSPVVGLQTYNSKGECWFEQRGLESKAVQTEESSTLNPSEILKERLRTLEQTSSVMARASIRKGDVKSLNRQSDYEFFLSRKQ